MPEKKREVLIVDEANDVAQMLRMMNKLGAAGIDPIMVLHPRPTIDLARFGGIYIPEEKPKRTCRLPGCYEKTNHNGGYCCAAHCKEHRTMLRTAKNQTAKNTAQNDDYRRAGFANRREYLDSVAEDFGVDKCVVYGIAAMLGPNEDFDGLLTSVEDYGEMWE
jgi:hypothetical protein